MPNLILQFKLKDTAIFALFANLVLLNPITSVFGNELNSAKSTTSGTIDLPNLCSYPTCYWTPTSLLNAKTNYNQDYRNLIIRFPDGDLLSTTWSVEVGATAEQVKFKLIDEISALVSLYQAHASKAALNDQDLLVMAGNYKIKKKRILFDFYSLSKKPVYLNANSRFLERMQLQMRGHFSGVATPTGFSIIDHGHPRIFEIYSDSDRKIELH
jgi:hypothetical protein